MDTQNNSEEIQKPSSGLGVPISIVIAGALVAFAIYSSPGAKNNVPNPNNPANQGQAAVAVAGGDMRAIDGSDHILGNPSAEVKLVEYSDPECPFCKRFHETMKQVMDEYGKDARVACVYRHLPLDSIHPKSRKEVTAAECAGKLGGNEKFWAYIDKIFEVTPSNNGLDLALLPKLAQEVGLDSSAFEQCLSGNEFDKFIEDSIADATRAGAQGTPYSIVISKSGKKTPINGALPYASVKQVIDAALAE